MYALKVIKLIVDVINCFCFIYLYLSARFRQRGAGQNLADNCMISLTHYFDLNAVGRSRPQTGSIVPQERRRCSWSSLRQKVAGIAAES
jgi:hypothetical protein